MRINVRVGLDSYDFAHPAEKQTQVYVELEDVARASYLLPADIFHQLKDQEWGDVLNVAHEHYEQRWVVSDSASAAARKAVREWLAVDENCDELNVAWFQDRAQKDPVSRSLLADKTRLAAEVERLTALVAAMHAASVGETRPPLLGLVEDVAITRSSFLAQQHRAEQLDVIARELGVRVGELEAERASTNLAVADAAVEREGLLKRIAELEAAKRPALRDVPPSRVTRRALARPLPAREAVCACGHTGLDHHHAGTACWAELPRGPRVSMAEPLPPVEVCGCKAFAAVEVGERS